MRKKSVKRSIVSWVALIIIFLGVIYLFNVFNRTVNKLSYSELMKAMDKNKITELNITPNGSAGIYELTGKMKNYNVFYIEESQKTLF